MEDTKKVENNIIVESMVDFVKMLKEDAKSQEEVELIKKYTQRIAQM